MPLSESMQNLTIIQASEENIDSLFSLEQACFQSPWQHPELVTCFAPPYQTFLACNGEQVQGYCVLYDDSELFEVWRIAVLPEYRGQGIADALMIQAISCAAELGYCRLILEVRLSNHRAIAFYERQGFEKIGRRKDIIIKRKM